MTAPDTLVALDERTKEELRPPCQARRYWFLFGVNFKTVPCTNPAEWIETTRCPAHGLRQMLVCTEDLGGAPGEFLCAPCSDVGKDSFLQYVGAEPLR